MIRVQNAMDWFSTGDQVLSLVRRYGSLFNGAV